MKIYKDYIKEIENQLNTDEVEQAKREALQDIFLIKLSELRRQRGIRQKDISSFSQSGISKLESRRDMKISTLIEYLNEIGMGVQISVYPKGNGTDNEHITLVKT